MAPTVKNCMDINNDNYDLGIMGDLNMMEHLNQTTKLPLLVKKVGEKRITMKCSKKQLMEKKEALLKKPKMTQAKMILLHEGKIMREKKLTRKT
jgi:hypothetical protein